MTFNKLQRGVARAFAAALFVIASAVALPAQTDSVVRVDVPVGRAYPIFVAGGVDKMSVTNPDVADVVAISPQQVVVNGKAAGETDLMIWATRGTVLHYRVQVHSPSDRMQVLVGVKFAEVRKTFMFDMGVSALFNPNHVRVGTGDYRDNTFVDPLTGKPTVASPTNFLTVLSNFGTNDFWAALRLEEARGNATLLAQPNIMAGNKEDATFLAGGQIPVPVVQNAAGGVGQAYVTIEWKDFGVRLNFNGEILNDSLIKLRVRPEVSSLDYTNAVQIAGFKIPALRMRRIESTMDMKRDQSLIISGLFDKERELVKNGVPLLMDIPILGNLFASTSWQNNETELIVIVTPMIVDPMHPPTQSVLQFPADTTRPAMDAVQQKPIIKP